MSQFNSNGFGKENLSPDGRLNKASKAAMTNSGSRFGKSSNHLPLQNIQEIENQENELETYRLRVNAMQRSANQQQFNRLNYR